MKPALLLYCQHSVGIGHLMRSLVIAEALTHDFRVVFLNGGVFPPGVVPPHGVEIVDLPPLGLESRHLVSRGEERDIDRIKSVRKAVVLGTYDRVRPEVVLVELFPFGRKKFAFELLPLLKRTRRPIGWRPSVLCSVRDILVSARPDQQHHDDRARWLCNRYFDGVMVHADPALAEFSESFRPSRPLAVPVHYTGFVARDGGGARDDTHGAHVLVSAGGGLAGGDLLRAAVAAHALAPAGTRRRMRIVAGPFLPESEWLDLRASAEGFPDIELVRSVPDLGAEMRYAAVSVSQCGYNTAMDILGAHVPALVVPYAAQREDEQSNRARRLAQLGLLRVLDTATLTPAALVREISATAEFRPARTALCLDGARRTAEIVAQTIDARRTARAHAGLSLGMQRVA